MPEFAVILPAAGASTRFGPGRNKLFANLAGRPILLRTLDAFLHRPDVPLIITANGQWSNTPPTITDALKHPKIRLCPGGPNRAQSVRNALDLVPPQIDWIAIHDAARPLVSQALIDRTLAAAVQHGAAVPAMPVSLTIKEASSPLPSPVQRTIPRHTLFAMQTPQIMRCSDLANAFATCPLPLDQITDDAQLLELSAHPVWLVEGEEPNLKITTAMDLRVAEMLIEPQHGDK